MVESSNGGIVESSSGGESSNGHMLLHKSQRLMLPMKIELPIVRVPVRVVKLANYILSECRSPGTLLPLHLTPCRSEISE